VVHPEKIRRINVKKHLFLFFVTLNIFLYSTDDLGVKGKSEVQDFDYGFPSSRE